MQKNNFLKKIITLKKEEISKKQNNQASRFLQCFTTDSKTIRIIAEIKFASPTNPRLGTGVNLIKRAKEYEQAGADAISIITEKHFFKGDSVFITECKKNSSLPVLQKDFIIDTSQIYEAKSIGADALLLIARLVNGKLLKEFVSLCFMLGIEPVVEIQNEEDLQKAVLTKTHIIAVNARDLETFTVDVVGACMLLEKIPRKFTTLGFSGIVSPKEALLYKESGAKGILIGTSLMKSKDCKGFIKRLQL